jgi:drug/metabolite transporter (DMT)-like permease
VSPSDRGPVAAPAPSPGTPPAATSGVTAATPQGSAAGYLMISGSYLVLGSIGALVAWTTAPESALLVVRFVTAGLVLGVVFARRRPWAGVRRPGIPARLLLMGLVDAATLLLFFIALRTTSVAIGMFLEFLAPVWIAVIAPRVFKTRTEPVVYGALAVALAGLVLILTPMLRGEGVHASSLGMLAGLVSGFGYATFQMIVKGLTNRGVGAVTIVLSEMVIDTAVLLPLALWQTVGAGYHMTGRDLLAGVILGVVCTAFAYTIWTEGMSRVRVQHAGVLGYLEPVSAPVYALVLLGQAISLWTIAGGALIVAAGVLVIVLGKREELVPA